MPKDIENSGPRTKGYVGTASPYLSVMRGSSSSDEENNAVGSLEAGAHTIRFEDGRKDKNVVLNTEDVHIPRPQNKFMLFRAEMCRRDIPELANVARAADKSKVISRLWEALSTEQKDYWTERADFAREEHERQYPDYKYHPKPSKSRRRPGPRRRKGSMPEYNTSRIITESRPEVFSMTSMAGTPLHSSTAHVFETVPDAMSYQTNWIDEHMPNHGTQASFASFLTGDAREPLTGHVPTQMAVSTPVVQMGVGPSLPHYAETDSRLESYASLVSNQNLGSNTTTITDFDSTSFYNQIPYFVNAFGVGASLGSPTTSTSGNNPFNVPSRPWDDVTPEIPFQDGNVNPSWLNTLQF